MPAFAEEAALFEFIPEFIYFPIDSNETDSPKIDLKYPFQDNSITPFTPQSNGGVYLNNPSNVTSEFVYDPLTGQYVYQQKIGDMNYRSPTYMTLEEYKNYNLQQSMNKYWETKQATEKEFNEQKAGFRPQLKIESETFDRIFGGNTVDIRPSGSAELLFGLNTAKTGNPAIPERNRKITNFDFDQRIQLNVIGAIGEKLKVSTNYNTESQFRFENQFKIDYTGNEDDLLQDIDAGNVSMPLTGSLITGSQSLFGIKTVLKFGHLTVTSVASQQQGKKQEIEVQGGSQVSKFEVPIDRYEQNRHFFLSQFFRDNFEQSLENPPFINSGVLITKVEVWVTNTRNGFEDTRNIIGFQDLGEGNPERMFNSKWINSRAVSPADNGANDMYNIVSSNGSIRNFNTATANLNALGMIARQDYQKVELARKLTEQEYKIHPQLGYISLNQEIQLNQVLAVAFQYTYKGKTYQVGEFSTDFSGGTNPLFLKMLKSTELLVNVPMFDLMMKNIYSLNAYQVKADKFNLNVWYLNQSTGVQIPFIPEGEINEKPLIQVLGLDKLNVNQLPYPDGMFDFIDNPQITIIPQNGKIMFPVLEPFGKTIREALKNTPELADKYAFDSLYTIQQALAQVRYPEKNRFIIKGTYQSSSSSEIPLNAFNIPAGSVTVTAGGRQLVENTDFTVDYNLGRVRIINTGILESGQPIKISLESQDLFNLQTKSLVGSRFDYKISDNFVLGATVMRLTERPITTKVNSGNEPIANTIWGFDGSYKTDAPILTRLVDKIPLIDTKEKSSFAISGEFAQLLPGNSRAIGKNGVSYIDDFEGSQSTIELRTNGTWQLASTPQGQPSKFPEGSLVNNVAFGYNRAKLAWYTIDRSAFFLSNPITPAHIKNDPDMLSNHLMREVYELEVFPNRQLNPGTPTNIQMLDLAYYPSERGAYNYDVDGIDPISGKKYAAGLNADGTLKAPESRWGGIMRRVDQNDFDAANIEFIQFWVMDPFNEDYPYQDNSGELYFNIGKLAEDVLRDEIKSFENALPTNETEAKDLTPDTLSAWGRVPKPGSQAIVNAFDNDPQTRQFQDVGLDGLRNQEERLFFKTNYLDRLPQNSVAYQNAFDDPSADDYNYYRDDNYDSQELNILERYKKYNGLDGNSPTNEQAATQNADGYPTAASTLPNIEDLNRDNNMDEVEAYYQYKVKISPQDVAPDNIGRNYITDMLETEVKTVNGETRLIRWYQFKIPIRGEDRERIGSITDFRSIQYIRMYMKGFKDPVFLRFARLEFIRGEWRKYEKPIKDKGVYNEVDPQPTFNLAAVNLEENGSKSPVNYILPPGIERQQNVAVNSLVLQNEQSMQMRVCDLQDGQGVAAYRNVNTNMLMYGAMQMFVHAEASLSTTLNDGDLKLFVRMGSDFDNNYYEYELPLQVTLPGKYNPQSDFDRDTVWPAANQVLIDFTTLRNLKLERNAQLLQDGEFLPTGSKYSIQEGDKTYSIVGNPNLAELKTIMIGIRNPKGDGNPSDDKSSKCAEVWVNELRLTDFNNKSGWAAIGRVTTKLADLALVSVSGAVSTPGFGSIDKRVQERQQELKTSFDASANVELHKFLPEKLGVKVPMYVGYSENVSKPQFSPLEPDLYFKDVMNSELLSDSTKSSYKQNSQSFTMRKSINFTNIRKENTNPEKKMHFYNIENFSASYSYARVVMHDINTVFNNSKTYRGSLAYNYSFKSKNYTPFSKIKFLGKSKYFALIKDFNFYLVPKQVAFNSDINRYFGAMKNRNNIPGYNFDMPAFYNKTFTWTRNYSFNYDLSKALKFDFQAGDNALIQEPEKSVARENKDAYTAYRDSIWSSIRNFGTTLDYRHTANLNYTVPLAKIPILNWINATARYSATYNWQRASFATEYLGNTVQNTRQISLNGTFNMNALYNKVPYLKKVNALSNRRKSTKNNTRQKTAPPAEGDKGNGNEADKKDDGKKKQEEYTFIMKVTKVLMGFQNATVTYSRNNGVLLPGWNRDTRVFGFDPQFESPGFGFLFGQQDLFGENQTDFADYAASKGWLVKEVDLNTQYQRTHTETFNLRGQIEPIKDLKIELTGNWTYANNFGEFYRWHIDEITNDSMYVRDSPLQTGNFSTSISTIKTAFAKNDTNNVNPAFLQFLENRQSISTRLSADNPSSVGVPHELESGFAKGYGSTSADVIIPAFIAAYTGKSTDEVKLNPFKNLPNLNWKVTYNGLTKLPKFKKHFKTFTLSHGYKSSLNIASYQTNLLFTDVDGDGFTQNVDINQNYITKYNFNVVNLSEQFSPLINIDATWQNSLITRFEIKRDRNISMSMANSQLTEMFSNEFTIGSGYVFKKVKWPFKTRKPIESPLTLRFDFSIRGTKTIIHKILEEINQPTAGQSILTIKFTADYNLNKSLTLRFYYDHVATNPVIVQSFPTANTKTGISLRFNLAQ